MSLAQQPADTEPSSRAHGAAVRVLLVEDEAMVALNLEALVEELGHTVVGIAATRAQALDLARHQPPQVAVVDVNLLDGRTGLQIADELAAAFGTIVVIATGNPEGIACGGAITTVVRKPYADAALLDAVRQAAGAALDQVHQAKASVQQVSGGA
jgi:CheY-like chemotaxis protein